MYVSDAAIQSLMDRIGFNDPVPPTSIVLTDEVKESATGRTFDRFHPYCTVENIEMCMPISNATVAPDQTVNNTRLNAYLLDLKRQAVLAALDKVFNNAAASVQVNSLGLTIDSSSTDYSALVLRRGSTFDCAIGFQMAALIVDLLQNSSRSNVRQRTGIDGMSLAQAMGGIVVQGQNGQRVQMAPGIEQKLQQCIEGIIGQLFPDASNTGNPIVRNASFRW